VPRAYKPRKRFQKNNTAGHPGVSWNKNAKQFEAYIFKFKKKHYLGLHKTLEKAIRARKKGEERYHNEDYYEGAEYE
jgi:hypothetical protein